MARSETFTALADRLHHILRWDRLPRPLGLLTLAGIRRRLRQDNLFDTGLPQPSAELLEKAAEHTSRRTLDGSCNDLDNPLMGSVGTRFGRNVPLERTSPEPEHSILEPNPRLISRELLTREQFLPATTLNVLAAAWLQFEIHDWFSHGKNEEQDPWELALDEDDPWPERPLRIPRTHRDPTSDNDPSKPPTFVTADSHWWDGSQIYGSDPRFAACLRAGENGKLRVGPDGLLPRDLEELVDLSGVAGNFWVGLGLLHTLFTLEHNAICDRLRAEHPTWSDDRLYDKGRLINAALMAKIHTVEWTPAIIAHPTTRHAMHSTWWGIAGESIRRRLGRLGPSDLLSGIPGSPTNHHGVPYSLTEEFVAVYRMHPLLPDHFTFRSVGDGERLEERTFPELGAVHTRRRLEEIGVANALYSLGIAHPGAISLHNYPRFLQSLERPDGTLLDLAATDILRIRERGVPRYNEFRRLVRLPPARSFEELTNDSGSVERIRRVYDRDIERVDLMIGLYAEPKPKGFGFSDTAFRVFILMAARRLKSDRFFTRDYTAKMYTRSGLDWINRSSMVSVLLRHYPVLAPALSGIENAFVPWAMCAGRDR
jgi:heme peroxidase